jgi:hypothetical protein
MRGTDERLRIAGDAVYAGLVAGVGAVLMVTLVSRSWPGAVALLAIVAAQLVVLRRAATVLTKETLTGGTFRRREVPWGDVRAVRASGLLGRVDALLADGTELPLPAVEWYAPRPEGKAPPRSAQRVVEWARAHGHDVELVQA